MRKLIAILFLNFLFLINAYAQNMISGIVKDDHGEPIMGAVIKVKNGTNNAITDLDGKFVIEATSDDILEISSVGTKTQEIKIGNRTIINVVMREDVESLGEVIVVAYGTAKKSTFTGSAAVVSEKRIQEAQVSNVTNALQGTGSGIQAISSSGQPGADATIRIRGVGSISGSSDPLIVLDGVPYDGTISSINPTDIASMTVLKDAASASIYGSRAANGVIVISTKQGQKDKDPVIGIRTMAGVSSRAVAPVKLLGTNKWVELRWEALKNGFMDNGDNSVLAALKASRDLVSDIGINPYGTANPEPVGTDGKLKGGLNPLWDDNWDKEIIGMGQRYETNLDISGGSKNTQYFLSGGYLNEKGMMMRSGFERFTSRLNITNQTKKWLKLNLNMNYSYSVTNNNDSQDSNVGNGALFGLNIPNFYPIYQRDPATGDFIRDVNGNKKYDFGRYRTSSFARYNLIASLPQTTDESKRNLVSLRTGGEIDFAEINNELEFLRGLKFKTSYSTDIAFLQTHSYTPSFIDDDQDPNKYDVIPNLNNMSASKYTYLTRSYTMNHVLSYDKEYDIHKFNVLIGQETYEYSYQYEGGSRMGFVTYGYDDPSIAANVSNFASLLDRYAIWSIFGKIDYNLMDKYNFSASYRRDGSSRFHPNNRWGNFWSVGLGWNMEKEDFIKDNIDFIDLLKLRASYGTSGNQNIGTGRNYYSYKDMYTVVPVGAEGASGFSSFGNPDLKWESNATGNIGVDYSLFENRIRGSIEVFQRTSDDLIYNMPLPASTGVASIIRNVGEVRNRGIELDIKGTIIHTQDFKWDLGVNLTHYKNVITKFPLGEVISGTKRLKVGSDIYAFYIREFAGNAKNGETIYDIITSTNEIVPVTTVQPGRPLWWIYDEATGKKYKTHNFNNATRRDLGSALPDLYGGINTDLKLYDFTLSVLLSYSVGGLLYASGDYSQFFNAGTTKGRTLSEDMVNRWTPENQDSDLPRLSTTSPSNAWSNTSSRFLFDASYMRLKNLTLSYNFPKNLISGIGVQNLSIFVQGENIFTIFGLDGVDPESGGLTGVTGYRYPAARVFSGGVSLKF